MTVSGSVLRAADRRVVHGFFWWLALIVAGGLVLRVGYVWHEQSRLVGGDGFAYHQQASALVDGKGFINPLNGQRSALHPPLWALLLALVALLHGTSWLDQQLFACAIGALTVGLVGVAGRRVAGDRAGLIAAGLAAIYAGLWVYERALLSEVLLLALIAATIALAYAFRDRPTTIKVVALAVLGTLMALTRSEQALVVPMLLVPLIVGARSPETGMRIAGRQRVIWGALGMILIIVLLMPWTLYTNSWLGRPVVLSDGFDNASRAANCDQAYWGRNTGSYDNSCNVGPDGATRARDYALDHIGRVPIVILAREGRVWGFWAPLQQVQHDSGWQRTTPAVNRLGLFEYWALVPLAALGVVVLRRRRVAVYPLLVFVLVAALAAAVTFGETRYRATAEVPIVVLAAVALDALIGRLTRHRTVIRRAPDAPLPAP